MEKPKEEESEVRRWKFMNKKEREEVSDKLAQIKIEDFEDE